MDTRGVRDRSAPPKSSLVPVPRHRNVLERPEDSACGCRSARREHQNWPHSQRRRNDPPPPLPPPAPITTLHRTRLSLNPPPIPKPPPIPPRDLLLPPRPPKRLQRPANYLGEPFQSLSVDNVCPAPGIYPKRPVAVVPMPQVLKMVDKLLICEIAVRNPA